MPGHGLSDAPSARGSYELGVQARRLTLLFNALGLERPRVAAQSMGGRVAFEVAMAGRIERLALFGAVGFGDVRPERAFAPFIPQIPGDLLSVLFPRRAVEIVQRRVYGKIGWFTERDIDEYWAPSQFPDVLRAQVQMLREFTWEPIDRTVLARCRVPTLVVFGTRDRTVRPVSTGELVAAMPDARLEWIEGGGHVVMEESPDTINRMLIDFLGG
jgi:pimeloyl-ACP methyl ester carboxylesterase